MASEDYRNYFSLRCAPLASRERAWKIIADYLQKKYFPKAERVLDLGAGWCGFINNIKSNERYAIDANDIILQSAQKGVNAFVQNCTNLSRFEKNFFDIVFASNLLEHLERGEVGMVLDESRRVLKPDGKLILLQPNFSFAFRDYFDDFTHKQIFTHVSLSDLVQAHDFKLKGVRPRFLPYSFRSRFPAHPLLVKLYLFSPIKPFAGQMLVVAEK